MATATYTWVFASGSEGLADKGDSANITFAYDGTDGNPAGMVKFTTAATAGNETELARNPSTGATWESIFSIPSGSTITSVQCTNIDRKRTVGFTSVCGIAARLIDSSGASVHTSGDLYTETGISGPTDISFASSSGTSRSVDASYQASSTDIRLELSCSQSAGSAGGATIRLDNITVVVTYTPGTTPEYIVPMFPQIVSNRKQQASREMLRAASEPMAGILAVGRLWFANLPDGRGAAWRTEVIAAENADPSAGAILFDGRQYIAIYSASSTMMVAKSGKPLDWSSASRASTGLSGRVYGAARNDAGTIVVLLGNDWYTSQDQGASWTHGGTGGWPLPATINAVRHVFVVMGPTAGTPKHWTSVDGGVTFA